MAISRVDKTGRVYLPQEVRMALDITPDQPLNVNVVEGKIVLEKKRSNIAEQGRGLFKLKKHVENVDIEIRTQSSKPHDPVNPSFPPRFTLPKGPTSSS